MRRRLVLTLVAATAFTACAQLEGLDAFEKVDCLDDCTAPSANTGTDAAGEAPLRLDAAIVPVDASEIDAGFDASEVDATIDSGTDSGTITPPPPPPPPPPPTCTDAIKNGTETDTDCGGTCPNKCADTKGCSVAADCTSGVCNATSKTCSPPACNDNTKNGTETDTDCGGTCTTKCAVGKTCAADADCAKSICSATKTCRLAKSCVEIKAVVPTAPSGVYTLDPDGAGPMAPFDAYCDMTNDGGGWTLALKADGNQTTFGYSSDLWTNTTLFNATSPDLDTTEAKLETFTSVPFDAIRVAIVDDAATRSLVIPLAATTTSLLTLFQAGPAATTLGRAAWLGLMAAPSLQPFCNAEGFDLDPTAGAGWASVRIGILGNESDDCGSPDSWLGIGGFGAPCGPGLPTTSVGNVAGCGGDNGDVNKPAFGYVFVR